MARYIPVTIDEAEEEKKGGNIGLPFGLCAKYGIYLPSTATPRDAWNALKDKTGMAPEDFYRDLRKEQDEQDAARRVYDDAYDSRDDFAARVKRIAKEKKFVPADTLQEVESYAENDLGIANADYKGIDDDWKNDLDPRGQVDIESGITKESYVSRELGIDKETANRYVSAIDAYADERYSDIRAYQRGEKVNDQQEIAGIAEDIEEYIKKAPRWNGGETYRGMGLSDDDLSKYTLGSVHDMGGVSSWSSEEEIARQFGDEYKKKFGNSVILHSKTQKKGTAIRHLSKYPGESGENEVIASNESQYKVIDKKMDKDGRIHIYMEEV